MGNCPKSVDTPTGLVSLPTLAGVGKENIKDLEPLLLHADKKVQKEAQDAIYALRAKP